MRPRLGLALSGGVLAGAVAVLLPTAAHAACTTPELPVAGCPLPAASASPTPSTAPTAAPATGPTTAPRTGPDQGAGRTPAQVVTVTPSPPAAASAVPLPPALATVAEVAPTAGASAVPGPVVVASLAPQPQPVPLAAATGLRATVALSGVVSSSFALVSFSLLALALLLAFLAGLRPAVPRATTSTPGGTVTAHRTRLWTGLGVLALAAVVGGVGWYRLSGEPALNRQIPFLASAGVLVVLLSVLGGSLIIAEQLRGDTHRIGELEDAVRALTEALSPLVEQPPRSTPEPEPPVSRPVARSGGRAAGRS